MVRERLIGLEALRGFAALYVVLHHSHIAPNHGLGMVLYFGQEAVILFFLLSGFVISYSSGDHLDAFKYLVARFKRIYPIFLVALLISYSSMAMVARSWVDPDVPSLLGNLLMLQDVSALKRGVWVDTYMGNSPLWSLSYEWWFYMLFIPVAGIGRERGGLVVAGAMSVVGWFLYWYQPNQIALFLQYFLIWWAGVEFARQYKREGRLSFSHQAMLFAFLSIMIFLQLLSVIAYAMNGYGSLKLGVDPVLQLRHFVAALVILVCSVIWNRFQFRGFMRIFGVFSVISPISYAIYVVHQPILNFFSGMGWFSSRLAVLFVSLPVIFIISRLLEGGFQGAINRLAGLAIARRAV